MLSTEEWALHDNHNRRRLAINPDERAPLKVAGVKEPRLRCTAMTPGWLPSPCVDCHRPGLIFFKKELDNIRLLHHTSHMNKSSERVRLNITITKEMYEDIREVAHAGRLSMAKYIRHALILDLPKQLARIGKYKGTGPKEVTSVGSRKGGTST